VVVEFDCGERVVLSGSEALWGYCVDHPEIMWEELASRDLPEGTAHRWGDEYREGQDLCTASCYSLEWRSIE
jgi:hypothetical protein